jgi:predicted transcriptional regulator
MAITKTTKAAKTPDLSAGVTSPPKRSISSDSLEMSRRITNVWRANKNKSGAGLTQQKAAVHLGVTQPMFSQMLHGTVSINPMMVLSVAALLRCDLRTLVGGLNEYKILHAVSPTTSVEIPVSFTLSGKPVTGKVTKIMTHTISEAFAVEIDTDEYAPRYSNGEYAIIDPLTKWEVGNQVLVRYGKGACLVRVVSRINGSEVTTHHPTLVGVSTTIDLTDPTITVRGVIRGVQFN